MSRSAFAARFTELVGEPVMSYVDTLAHERRGGCAEGRGRDDRPSSRTVSATDPRPPSARAFKRVIGVAPGTIKRRAGEQDGAPIAAAAG